MKQTPCSKCGHTPTKTELLEKMLRKSPPPTLKQAITALQITRQHAYEVAKSLGLRFTLERDTNAQQ